MAEPAPLPALLGALNPQRRRQLAWLTGLTIVTAAADLLFVASAMLFLASFAGGPVAAFPAPLRILLEIVPERAGVASAAILFGAAAFAANAIRLDFLSLSERFIAQVTHELSVEVQRRVFAQPYEYHVNHHSSELIAALEKVQQITFNFLHQCLAGAGALITGAAILALLVSLNPVPALAAFAALAALYLGIARISGRWLAANSAHIGPIYAERVRMVQESSGAIRDLIIDHSQHAQLAEFRRADESLASVQASSRIIAAAPRFIVEAGAIVLLAALAGLLATRGSTLMLIGGIALGGMRVLPLFQAAYRSWANLVGSRAIIDDVLELLNLPVDEEHDAPVAPLPFGRSIRLEAVAYDYPGRAHKAVDNVTLEILRGQRVALVGETGSGKSTLADLLMGLLTPQTGSILIDGMPLYRANIRAWQRNIAHVSQNIFLADASIARNIAFSVPDEPPDMARVRQAAARAGIAKFIESLPDGYDTVVGERGGRLSGGQRQRIGIARALYKDAPLLVLDEATNALDEDTEAKVLANLFADRKRTILIIAHRPSALQRCDQTIRLSEGRIFAR